MKWYRFLFAGVITIVTFLFSLFGSVKPVAEYLFLQQYNDMCMAAPMINLERLEKFLAQDPTLKNIDDSQCQWFGEADRFIHTWHRAFDRVNGYNYPDPLQNLKTYLRGAVEHGPVSPRFYDKDGNSLFEKLTGWGGLRGYFNLSLMGKFALTPYFFMDFDALQAMAEGGPVAELVPWQGLFVPVVKTSESEDSYAQYDSEKHEFTRIDPESIKPEFIGMSEWNQKEQFIMNSRRKEKLGFAAIAQIYSPTGSGFGCNGRSFFPYQMGLEKLIFLVLGIDDNNEVMTEESEFYKVYSELKTLVNKDLENNPWSDKYLNRDKFLQYKLAEIFKKDRDLFEQARAVVKDLFINPWAIYEEFINDIRAGKVYKQDHTPYVYDEVKKYLPGPEQAMAYCFMHHIRLLWYGTLNVQAYYDYTVPVCSVTEGRFFPSFLAKRLPVAFEEFKARVSEKKAVNGTDVSFMDVWREIASKLAAVRPNWISFDAHGWVVSFDGTLIQRQREAINASGDSEEQKEKKIELLNQLGITGIESSHSAHFNSFYKREQKAR